MGHFDLGNGLDSLSEGHAYFVRRALEILTSFFSTYRCEQGFSTGLAMNTKKRNRLELSIVMRE